MGSGWVVLVIAVVLGGAALVGFWFAKDPTRRGASVDIAEGFDNAAEGPESTSQRLYSTADRPAGPDAEATDPETIGGDQSPPKGRSRPGAPNEVDDE